MEIDDHDFSHSDLHLRLWQVSVVVGIEGEKKCGKQHCITKCSSSKGQVEGHRQACLLYFKLISMTCVELHPRTVRASGVECGRRLRPQVSGDGKSA